MHEVARDAGVMFAHLPAEFAGVVIEAELAQGILLYAGCCIADVA